MHTASWTDWLEERIGHWAIPRVTRGIAFLSALVVLFEYFSPGFVRMLSMQPSLIISGEWWRLFTFIFVPEAQVDFVTLIYLLFTWYVGDLLEAEWGAFKLNLYLLLSIFALIAATFIFGLHGVDMTFVHTSFLFTFGTVFPKMEIITFPIPLPIQARFLAMFYGVLVIFQLLGAPWGLPVMVASLAGYILFFLPAVIEDWRDRQNAKKRMAKFRGDDE